MCDVFDLSALHWVVFARTQSTWINRRQFAKDGALSLDIVQCKEPRKLGCYTLSPNQHLDWQPNLTYWVSQLVIILPDDLAHLNHLDKWKDIRHPSFVPVKVSNFKVLDGQQPCISTFSPIGTTPLVLFQAGSTAKSGRRFTKCCWIFNHGPLGIAVYLVILTLLAYIIST